MGVKLNQKSYRKLIEEDIAWLDTMPNCLERTHIKAVLRKEANIPSINNEIEEERLDTITKRIFDYWCDIPPLEKGTILCIFDNKDMRTDIAKRFKTYPTHIEKCEGCMVTDGDREAYFFCPNAERFTLCGGITYVVFVNCCSETMKTMADALKYHKIKNICFIDI